MDFGAKAAFWSSRVLLGVENGPPQPVMPDLGWWYYSLILMSLFSVLGLPFWVWMLWHCYKHEPDREFWFWVMIFIPPASIVYFFARWLSGGGTTMPKGLKRWSRSREIEQLEIAARQIGNPHQWIQLGDALRDVGRFAEAADAYQKALAKEADNIQALWGAGIARLELKQFPEARTHLEKGLAIKPDYKFGDMSLAYGRTLCELGEIDRSAAHLEQHILRWRHAEALYLLAMLELERGNTDQARNHLEGLLLDIKGSPNSIARKQSRWKSRAAKLLKQIPR
jgi:hypothetical protein